MPTEGDRYTNKAHLRGLKPRFFVVRAGGESIAAGGFPDPSNWRSHSVRGARNPKGLGTYSRAFLVLCPINFEGQL